MDALQRVVDRGLGSALILEDDVDWDVALRQQIGPVAAAVRMLTDAAGPVRGPYGDDWDLLFLGHCGDALDDADPAAVLVDDPTLIPARYVRSVYDVEPYAALGERTRVVQRSAAPVCLFGYAVTARSARQVLRFLQGEGREVDLKLRMGCESGALRCVSVAPELFHHQRRVGSKCLSTSILGIEEDRRTLGRTFTHNIKYSARCNWNRWGRNLVHCLPTWPEWHRYIT